jgi:hypothetical protein
LGREVGGVINEGLSKTGGREGEEEGEEEEGWSDLEGTGRITSEAEEEEEEEEEEDEEIAVGAV